MIRMELSRIVISEINNQQVIFLREADGEREFPIIIGIFEATSIDRRVKEDYNPPRPLTHDLIRSAIELLGGTLQDVAIHHLKEQTYFASLRIRRGDELLELDARPSDAIAVAATSRPMLPILIAEEVLEKALSQERTDY